jgi:hypothetical protein
VVADRLAGRLDVAEVRIVSIVDPCRDGDDDVLRRPDDRRIGGESDR